MPAAKNPQQRLRLPLNCGGLLWFSGVMIHIDGSYKEGGGQIIRTALSLSALTGKSFRAEKIRYNRTKPGLKNQHLACIKALKQLCSARVKGAQAGSDYVEFIPGKIKPRTLSVDIGTAGSITLLLQSLLLPCMFADGEVRLKIKGGTDTKWSIPVDYFVNVILPHYENFAYFQFNDIKRGYYPKGQGFVDMTIKPKFSFSQIKAVPHFDLVRRTSLTKIKGISSASQKLRNAEVAKRQASGAKKKLSSIGCPVNIVEEYTDTASTGTIITMWVDSDKPTIGADALGEKRKRAEAVGAEAAAKLLLVLHSDAVVDSHLADNLVPLLALVGGAIKTDEITDHILSNVYVCEKFLKVRFAVDGKEKMIAV